MLNREWETPAWGLGFYLWESTSGTLALAGGMFLFYCWVTVLVASIVLSAYKTTSLITNF